MPHDFPTKRFRVGEPVDPDAFNENFQAVAGKLAGRLGEQDIDGPSLKASVLVEDEAYYDAHHVVYGSSPAWTRGGVYALRDGDAGEDPAVDVPDSAVWNSLGTPATRLTFQSGDDTLLIFAQAQHVAWQGVGATAVASTPPFNVPVRLQYALEVDGVLLDDTVTGAFFYPDPPAIPFYRASPATATEFDWRHVRYVQNTVGINNAVRPARLVRSVPVLAGQHTVELKARRVPRNDFKIDDDTVGVQVQVFNRRLFVLRIKGKSPYSGGIPNVIVEAVEDGEVITVANVFTDAMEHLRTTANSIRPENVERAALRNEHLPSVVYGPRVAVQTQNTSIGPWTGQYPGYDTNSAAWDVIDDGVTPLEVTGPDAGEWRLDNNPGLFVVLANVQVPNVKWDPTQTDLRAIGCFAIAVTNSAGTRRVIGATEVYVNGHNRDPYTTTLLAPHEDDVTLMWVVDSEDLSAADQRIAKIEVVVSQYDGATSGAGAVEVYTQRGSVCAFALKGVHT